MPDIFNKDEHPLSTTNTLSFELDIISGPLGFDIMVSSRPVRLSDIVPLARDIATRLALAMVGTLRSKGQCVQCRKGCSSICSYLVPLSVPEVFRQADELSAMPESEGQPLIKSSIETARKILENMPADLELSGSQETNGGWRSNETSDWYAGLGLPCPFLSDGLCVLYEQRPIACREYLVTGSARLCDLSSKDQGAPVEIPVSILECLGRLTAELEQSDVEAVILPLSLPWAQENIERSKRTWPAMTVVERFIEIIQTTARTCAPAAQP